MPQKKSKKLPVGSQILVKKGVNIPEFPDVCAEDWKGMVVEAKGRGADLKYIIEWEDSTLEAMPKDYVEHCETAGLYHRMACLLASEVEGIE